MARKRVLIADDSSFMRLVLRQILDKETDIEVVGTAANGFDAVEMAKQLRPDLVTMDIEMPRMDGITALKRIMAECPTKVIMVSTLTTAGASATFDALEAGAVDYIAKNITDNTAAQGVFKTELLRRIKGVLYNLQTGAARQATAIRPPAARFNRRQIKCVAIGASTGGPVAVQEVLSRIPVDYPHGIVVAIHMPAAFTGAFAARLNDRCSSTVKEAKDGDIVKPGLILLAPGGKHTKIVSRAGQLVIQLLEPAQTPGFIYVPAVDILMESMSEASRGAMLGVVLTGMGSDGAKGIVKLKAAGGQTIAQDAATCTIYGMPKAIVDAGNADQTLPLGEIGTEISRYK